MHRRGQAAAARDATPHIEGHESSTELSLMLRVDIGGPRANAPAA